MEVKYDRSRICYGFIAGAFPVVAFRFRFERFSALDGKVKIWNATNGALVRTIDAHIGEVKQVDISPDGSMIDSASSDQTCKI